MNDTFKNNPELHEYFETSDGQKFYSENLAKNHARSLDGKVKHVTRNDEENDTEAAEVKPEKAADILAKVPEMDLETVNEYLAVEIALPKPRKSVVEALEDRINELDPENEDPENDEPENQD